jgi:hypothetical protein
MDREKGGEQVQQSVQHEQDPENVNEDQRRHDGPRFVVIATRRAAASSKHF